ncbi:MAG: asparagine synthase (glutamine-hydrolyzing) [Chloroflexi bacterium]|nr:asparagine synthase (glutamine-hydrolyzing) [Chloroflexota bacterium]
MCGIAGIIDLSDHPIDPRLVKSMCDAMSYRGPDAEGLEALPHAVLGHRRLSILDLSPAGNQPMTTKNRRLWTVFNGEIYNHRDLRRELEAQGHSYASRSDTETLLHGYQEWGTGISARCRGMWAFAIWDSERQALYISRDRMGEKPLYYYRQGNRLAFASNLAALRPALDQQEINPAAVASLLAYEYIPFTESIYQGVEKLPPAHYLVFDRNGLRVAPYWELDYREKLDITLPEAERLVEDTLASAVREQLEADVPVGVFLSGGVDSGYVAALAAREKPDLVGVTVTIPGNDLRNEADNARKVARTHGLHHIEVPLDTTCIQTLPSLLAGIEPLGDSSLIPVSAVAQAARKHMTVVLTGDGGDEGFDGYGKPRQAKAAQELRQGKLGNLWRALGPALTFLSRQRITSWVRLSRIHASGAKLMAAAGIENYLGAWEATPYQVRDLLYGPRLGSVSRRRPGARLIEALGQVRYKDWWEGVLGVEIKTRLVDDFLLKVDTSTMHYSLESRAPFLDYRLIEIAARLPWEIWLPDEHSKGLLKRLAARHNPPEVVYSQKKGFSIPVEQYFLEGWGKMLLELTRDGVAAQMGLIDPDGVRRYLQMHGLRANHRLDRQLFSLFVLEIWLRVFHARTDSAAELGGQLLRNAH